MFERIVTFFMPAAMRSNISHSQYHEFRVVVSTCLIGLPLVLLFPVPLYYLNKPYLGYLVNGALVIITLFCSRYLGHYRVPMSITALVTYFIIYEWIRDSGQIFSSNVSLLHMYLLCAIWADKRYGWWAIFTNLILFYIIYHNTQLVGHTRGDALYALIMNCLITIFFGGFLAYLQLDQERDRLKIKSLQEEKISVLDDAVKQRTEQLNSMRETLATDFHDETGNMLSAITRQASMLKLKLIERDDVQLIVESIIKNSKRLYASSKDFLWQLNHNSDDPAELFDYLTGYGQLYYNQFDIAFSSDTEPCERLQLDPSAALNLIFIFKEAMTNVTEHSGATIVHLTLTCQPQTVCLTLNDNGTWKTGSPDREHYGLGNIEKRCKKNGFTLDILKTGEGTRIGITAPVRSAQLL
ncbi:sensor histidine kinase [Mucilaginibacter calamicampi]|uniref:histidine kinase n=1 Tax=Mucilaginibacter calamicampi TaxID=1302352 RepID=A0ABW2YY39_9SPHI